MKLTVYCLDCMGATQLPDGVIVDVDDAGYYEITCRNGHQQRYVQLMPKWELLFDASLYALQHTDYHSAVTHASTSQDAFYAFCIAVVLRAAGVSDQERERVRAKTKLAERRLGAMHLAYAMTKKTAFSHDSQKRTELRNRVVHDGYLPTRKKAFDYVEGTYNALTDAMVALKATFPAHVESELMARLEERRQEAQKRCGAVPGTQGMLSAIGLQVANPPPKPFEAVFEQFTQFNWWENARRGFELSQSAARPQAGE